MSDWRLQIAYRIILVLGGSCVGLAGLAAYLWATRGDVAVQRNSQLDPEARVGADPGMPST